MNRTLLLGLQIGVAVAIVAIWHILTTTTLIGDPDRLQFFFSTPVDVARQIWAWFANGSIWYHLWITLSEAILAFVIGAVAVIQTSGEKAAYAKPLSRLIHAEFTELLHGFTDIFYAQIKISAINTVLTAVYLLGILPLIGKPLPMAGTLVMVTFFAGLLPVVGNLISNTFIVILSLSDSLAVTIMSLLWLVGIHKLEYFLNAHIIGHKIKAAMWELLIVMIVLEAAFGMAGLVSAPVIYAQAKRSLHNHGWI